VDEDQRSDASAPLPGEGRFFVRPNGGAALQQAHPDLRQAISAAGKLGPGRHLIEHPALEVIVTVQAARLAAPPAPAARAAAPAAAAAPPAPPRERALVGARIFGLCRNRGGESPIFRTWADMWRRYCSMQEAARFPQNVILKIVAAAGDYQRMRWGLATALLGEGGYTVIDPMGQAMPWYDEYDAAFGLPIDPVPDHSVTLTGTTWMRRYEGGLALVNTSAEAPDTIAVPSGYRRINGRQDPEVNSGATVSDLRLPPQSGILLVKA
jgi:hypothetical protein